MKVTEDIHRIDGMGFVNVYAVIDAQGVTLVDTGLPGRSKAILGYLSGLGLEPADVRTIVLTHGDNDHIGSVAALQAATGAKIAIHEADAPALTGAPYERATGISRALFALLRPFLRTQRAEPDILLRDGDTVAGLRVRHMPGHTAGSIVLTRPDGVVFSGDALLGDAKGDAEQPRKMLAYDYGDAVASAGAIEAMGYTLLLPGHGEPVRR
jgi:glyoxylase-like metal-dependent hydrolase (beta-lactamase superfamily II)